MARGTLAAAAGVSTVGLRPPFDTPQRHSHPVCRAILTLIVALENEANPASNANSRLDQSAQFQARNPSLNYPTRCLIVVDTFRTRSTSGLRKENGRWLVAREHHSYPVS